jgi:hypothetical protein
MRKGSKVVVANYLIRKAKSFGLSRRESTLLGLMNQCKDENHLMRILEVKSDLRLLFIDIYNHEYQGK